MDKKDDYGDCSKGDLQEFFASAFNNHPVLQMEKEKAKNTAKDMYR